MSIIVLLNNDRYFFSQEQYSFYTVSDFKKYLKNRLNISYDFNLIFYNYILNDNSYLNELNLKNIPIILEIKKNTNNEYELNEIINISSKLVIISYILSVIL